ncbi:hypothetical protein [Janthinobacterium sp. HLX7-2]|uniref:hypothetical protein n=1 Tax=Janthinobacterium sp. HLX7-2 TaxID=1259331 RepID=UPI003F28660E
MSQPKDESKRENEKVYKGCRNSLNANGFFAHALVGQDLCITACVNARVGYKFSPKLRLSVEVYNLTNRRDSAIDYAYESRLPGEAAEGKFDVHFHPIESRSIRANLIANF